MKPIGIWDAFYLSELLLQDWLGLEPNVVLVAEDAGTVAFHQASFNPPHQLITTIHVSDLFGRFAFRC